ncbi:MAG: hypothetical protein JWM27_138 [Gemmatimonadetes bacterium]|nr:hypothetical protein [Gemmatimonadota bacterium]
MFPGIAVHPPPARDTNVSPAPRGGYLLPHTPTTGLRPSRLPLGSAARPYAALTSRPIPTMRRLPLPVLLAACLAVAHRLPAQGSGGGGAADAGMGVHGMLAFGDGHLYLSHLPLYHAPHAWQVVMEAKLEADSATSVTDPAAAWAADRAAPGAGPLYTVEPEAFPLAGLRALADGGAPVKFRATVYRGHFERGGRVLVSGALVEVTRVLWMRPIDAEAPHPRSARWVLFGAPGETYLAHQVAGMPDFDQVARVDGAAPFDAAELGAGVDLVLDGHAADAPLRDGDALRAHMAGTGGTPWALRVVRSLYLERGDLATL